jgi:hypothetical protein
LFDQATSLALQAKNSGRFVSGGDEFDVVAASALDGVPRSKAVYKS